MAKTTQQNKKPTEVADNNSLRETASADLHIVANFIAKRAKTCSETELNFLDSISNDCIVKLARYFGLDFSAMIEAFSYDAEKITTIKTAFENLAACLEIVDNRLKEIQKEKEMN